MGMASQAADEKPRTWRIARMRDALEPRIEAVLAEQATTYWNRPLRRAEVQGGEPMIVRWSIDGDLVAVLEIGGAGPAQLRVHDVGALEPLRRSLRGQRVVIVHEPRNP